MAQKISYVTLNTCKQKRDSQPKQLVHSLLIVVVGTQDISVTMYSFCFTCRYRFGNLVKLLAHLQPVR